MKSESSVTLSLAALCLALAVPALASARTPSASAAAAENSSTTSSASAIATQMVRARAALVKNIDSRTVKTGSQVQARLADKVHLKNGKELPSGTVLLGTVTADSMQSSGAPKLALKFTQAKLKNGTTIPIQATIVGVAGPKEMTNEGYDIVPGAQMPNTWDPTMLQVDAVNALSGIDMHSRIAGNNSGVFISNKKHDMKLEQGTELALALRAAS